jgi:hypothetical protein
MITTLAEWDFFESFMGTSMGLYQDAGGLVESKPMSDQNLSEDHAYLKR